MAVNRLEHPITLDEMIDTCRRVSTEIAERNASRGIIGDVEAETLWAAAYELEKLKRQD